MKKLLIALIVFSLLAQSSWAIYAPRAMGMGGAFTAIADDAFAAYWNPAGLAVNPGISVAGHYQMNNRNQQIGDNALALKGCFEIEMNPFQWVLGVGLVSILALEGSKQLANQGVIKKNWGRTEEAYSKTESLAPSVKAQEEQMKAEGQTVERQAISRKEVAKSALKTIGRTTIQVADKFADVAVREAARQSARYMYASPWYTPHYYRPSYWDNRYAYQEREITPAGKAQFGGGFSVMSDTNEILQQNSTFYTFSVASGWGEIVALGANLNIYDLQLTNYTPSMRGIGGGLDIGALLRISDKLMFGVTAKEVLTTDVKFENGITRRYQMSVNSGMAVKPIQQVTVAYDVHNIFGQNAENPTSHYGVEVRPIYGVAVRAGMSDNSKTAGISFGAGPFVIDYTYLGGAYGRTQLIGATWTL